MIQIIGIAVCVYGMFRLLQAIVISHSQMSRLDASWLPAAWVLTIVGVVILGLLALLLLAQGMHFGGIPTQQQQLWNNFQ